MGGVLLVVGPAFGGGFAKNGESIKLGGLGFEGGAVRMFVAMTMESVTKFFGKTGMIGVG